MGKSERKATSMKRLGTWLKGAWRRITPGARAWRGAAWGALIALIVILLVTAYGLFGQAAPLRFAIGALFLLTVFALVGGLLTLIWWILKSIPAWYVWALACAVPLFALLTLTAMSVSIGIVVVGAGTLVVASLLGASVIVLVRGDWREMVRVQRVIAVGALALGLVGLIGGGIWLLNDGSPPAVPPDAAAQADAEIEPLDVPDPSERGAYAVRTLTYGSGGDRHRLEYGADADLITHSVDGSALIERWSGLRTAYWGFGPDALPLNGRVWYPDGEGPFPLVVIVHGQHPMEDFSDAGYTYLGELLASRGFIVVSVDENFLNLSPLVDLLIFQSLVEEDDLRGWLLLEHLQVWRDWNADSGNVFYQQVDLENVALIGHSRGGEAVAIATAFNELPAYPDDASVRFDYGFGIRSVVAFAPVEGMYQPAGQDVVLENVNYLVLHGAHDMDVFTFQGDRQYSRVQFTDEGDWFKASLYIYGANHGQFNTHWGRKDLFEPIMRVFNLEQLIPGEDQRQIAKVAVSAFLEATLREQREYRPLFRDIRRGRTWLPDTVYLHQYRDSTTQMVATYDEDVDLTSTTLPGGRLTGEGLTIWREQPAEAKWETLGDQTVHLGWDVEAAETTPSYQIEIPQQGLTLSRESVLVFSLADAGEDPTPETDEEKGGKRSGLIDLTVEVVDGVGEVARLPLSHFSFLQPQLEAQLGKAGFMSPFPSSEVVLQHFEFPLEDFTAVNSAFDPADLAHVRFVFDRTEAGVVVLDNVGFSK